MLFRDQVKLLEAGFTIIKPDDIPARGYTGMFFMIKAKTPDYKEWHIYQRGFMNTHDRNRRLRKLLKQPNIIHI